MAVPAQIETANGGREYDPRETVDIGADLREARERRGVSIDQLSRTTKVTVRILRSIETNQFEKLPQSVFLRGFLRAYAREVGLDPEDTVRRYLTQFQQPIQTVEAPPRSMQVPDLTADRTQSTTEAFAAAMRTFRAPWLVITVVVAIAAYGMIRWPAHLGNAEDHLAGRSGTSRSIPPGTSATGAPRPEVGTAGSGTSAAIATAPDVLSMTIHAQGLCWVSAIIDGTNVVSRLMQPGETRTMEVRHEAVLRVGDPAAFAFAINGAQGRSLGRAGEPVTIRITKQNYRDLLGQQTSLGTTGR